MEQIINFLLNNANALIILVGVILLIIEIVQIIIWSKLDFQLINTSINFLQNNNKKQNLPISREKKLLQEWILRHLKGEIIESEFKAEIVDNYFILTAYPRILSNPVPKSWVYFAPTLLTALGILGTFLGIVTGLQKIGISNINDTTQLLESSTQLLEGMKTAFSTSLAGLGSASLMMIILALGANFRQTYRNSWRKKLNEIAYLESSEKLLSRLDTSSMKNVADKLGEVSQNIGNLANLTPENIALAIKQVIAYDQSILVRQLTSQNAYLESLSENLTPLNIASAIAPIITPINEELIALRKQQEEQQSTIQLLVKQLRNELIEPVVQRLDESAELTKEASLAVRELKNELGGIAQSLAGAVQTIQEFQKDTLTKLQDFAHNLETILAEFRTDTKGVLEQVAVEINSAVAQSIEGMTAQRNAFEISATKAAQTFKGIREDLQQALETQANQQKEMLESVKTSTEDILEQANLAFEKQSNTIINIGKEASELMNQARENLISTLTNIDSMLQNTRETVQEELEKFRLDYQKSLTQFFEEQNNLLNETLGKQREGLAQVVKDLDTTFKEELTIRKQMTEEVNQSLENIQKTVKVVNNLTTAVGMNSSERIAQLQELASTIGNEAAKVEKAYSQMTKQFNYVLQATNEKINEYLTEANKSYINSFENADQAIAKLCNNINQSSHGLMNVAEYLVAAANDLKSSK
jgi:MotA/TolQ/ExbB proton channel family